MSPVDKTSVAVIGAGPSGLAVAKHLLEHGLEPVIFEQSDDLGGQWHAEADHSGVWPAMPANTSSVTTRFSDFPHERGARLFLSNRQVHAYLRRYAERFNVNQCLRLNTPVLGIETTDGQWKVRYRTGTDAPETQTFAHVVAASGRYNKPRLPSIAGLDRFSGAHTVMHSFDYAGPEAFAGQRVLVVGNSISGLEICADLAADPRIRVISSCRKPRYILSKILGGIPADCLAFNRFASLAFRALPPPQAAEGLKQLILRFCGSPEQYGGLQPSDDILEANISQCQNYLPFVAEGRITVAGAPVSFTDEGAAFENGTSEAIDAAIFATGFDLNLPYLGGDLSRILNVDASHLDLYRHTFHPDLPGLAFIGMYCQVGPYLPVVELQARWVAAVISGAQALPSADEMRQGLAAHQAWRQMFQEVLYHDMAISFAEAAGVTPRIEKRPELAKALMFGPLSPIQFRMDGPGSDPDAAERFLAEVSRFGDYREPELAPDQADGLRMLAANLRDERWLQELAARLA